MRTVNYKFVLSCDKQTPLAYFVLGYSESQQTFDNQLMWPKENWPLTVLCNQCFQLSDYLERDVQTLFLDNKVQGKPRPMRIWSIEVQCGQESCGTLTKIHYQAESELLKEQILLEIDGRPIDTHCRKCGQATVPKLRSDMNVNIVAEI
jgi:hypothetical protein